jgi:hypothetical protein
MPASMAQPDKSCAEFHKYGRDILAALRHIAQDHCRKLSVLPAAQLLPWQTLSPLENKPLGLLVT